MFTVAAMELSNIHIYAFAAASGVSAMLISYRLEETGWGFTGSRAFREKNGSLLKRTLVQLLGLAVVAGLLLWPTLLKPFRIEPCLILFGAALGCDFAASLARGYTVRGFNIFTRKDNAASFWFIQGSTLVGILVLIVFASLL